MIVKKNAAGQWMDDNNHDWSIKVSGAQAANSGRPVGWNLPDRDLARIDASSLSVTYATGIMNILMASGVNPATGEVTIVGTDATNERRFEPNVRGRFVHVNIGLVNPSTLASTVKDLNPHLLPYTNQQVTQSERNKSIGDPRGVAWNPTGTRAFIAGMGSDNVVVVNTAGDRAGLADTIPVGRGPTGVAFDAQHARWLLELDAVGRVINTSGDRLRAPTETDIELTVPARCITDLPTTPDRRGLDPSADIADAAIWHLLG